MNHYSLKKIIMIKVKIVVKKKKSEIMLISISLETKKVMKEEQLQSLFKKNINITDLGLNTIQRQDINLCYFYSYVSSTRRNDNVEAKNDLTIEWIIINLLYNPVYYYLKSDSIYLFFNIGKSVWNWYFVLLSTLHLTWFSNWKL